MQKSLFTLLAICLCAMANAQNIDKLIKEKKITKIISTLAADDMRGRSALIPNDIDKAASFIEKEFKKAGLKPLDGLTSYRQEFQKNQLSLTSLEVIVNGKAVPKDRLIYSSSVEEASMNSETPIDTIGKSQPLFPTLMAIEKKDGDKIILVSKEHGENFKVAQGYLNRPKIIDPNTPASGSTLYILDQEKPVEILVKAKQAKEIITMANVVGVLQGKSRADEMVIFSGHYDHIGINDPIEGDSIANGADDDASGTTAVIALANYFRKAKINERTLVFVAFTAEEIGGFGSQHFSKQLDPDKVVAMFNIEMIGKQSKWGQNAAFITGFERSNFGEILQKNLEGSAFKIYPDPYPEQNLFYRSDNAMLARLGVPAHSISTDQIPTDPFYHTVNDELATLDMANIIAAIRGIALSSRSIVDGSDTPNRVDKTKVK